MIVKVDSFVIQGKTVELKRDKWKLTTDAVPHQFPGIPKYFNFKPSKRKAPKIKNNQARQQKRKKTEEPKIISQEPNAVSDAVYEADCYKYVLTAKLNQDPAERHFGLIRGLSSDDHPTSIDFLNLHQLQSIYVPVKGVLSSKGNCEDTIDNKLTSFTQQIRNMTRINVEKSRNIEEDIEKQIREKISLTDIEPELTPLDLSFDDSATRSANSIVYYLCSFLNKKRVQQRRVLTEEELDEIGARLEHSSRKSLRRLAQEVDISKTSALMATKFLKLKPYMVTTVHALQPQDPQDSATAHTAANSMDELRSKPNVSRVVSVPYPRLADRLRVTLAAGAPIFTQSKAAAERSARATNALSRLRRSSEAPDALGRPPWICQSMIVGDPAAEPTPIPTRGVAYTSDR
ncbi:hypothetical protein ANN_13143 [Periplaneta americana]|uniref:Uncharacterized protein n=1 Tax=Periplaneta americana TaxID=6978 RepID=A0ABQ8TL50_PERAM|nr:hypothetical protein ANN_13143 [Periplaneta americana]